MAWENMLACHTLHLGKVDTHALIIDIYKQKYIDVLHLVRVDYCMFMQQSLLVKDNHFLMSSLKTFGYEVIEHNFDK